jgi:Fur family peroxide stress response transcriptional regulator
MAGPEARLEQMMSRLKEQGLRLTPQRLAILRILASSANHPSIDMIYEQVRAQFPTTSLATVYKTVTLLKELGEVLELGFPEGGNRYDGNKPYPHPHVVCMKCGKITDPELAPLESLLKAAARQTGFRIMNHRLDFFGLCPQCQTQE